MAKPRLWTGGNSHRNSSGLFGMPSGEVAQGPPPGMDPFRLGGRTPARWTLPFQGYNQPILELPQNKSSRITLASNAYLGDPIINSAAKLTICMALENIRLTVTSKCQEIPKWIPEKDRQRYIADYGQDKPGQIAAAYVKQKCLEQIEYMDITGFIQNEALDFLVAGDAYINLCSTALPAEEQLVWNAGNTEATIKQVEELKRKWIQEGRNSANPELAYNIYALQGLNPSAVWMYPDYTGRVTNAKIVHLLGEGVWDLNLDNLIHLKAPTFTWTVYGISHYIAALRWVDIKFKTMEAMYTNSQRYITPREWLEIQGPKDINSEASLPPTDEQMDYAEQILSCYSMNMPFVLPGGWKWNYLGAEGKVLDTSTILEKIDDAIRTAAQVSRTFTSGAANVPAYATAKLQAGVMDKAVQPLARTLSRAIEGRILQRFCLFNGFFEEDGTLIAPKVAFHGSPIKGDDSIDTRIANLGSLNWLSPITAWEWLGIDPSLEQERLQMSKAGLVEPFRAIAPDLSPSQTPDRYDELREEFEEKLALINFSRSKGHKRIINQLNRLGIAYKQGDKNAFWEAERQMNIYLTQSQIIRNADAKQLLDTAIPWEDQVLRQQEELDEAEERQHDDDEMNTAASVSTQVFNTRMKSKGTVNGGSIVG